VLKYTCCAEVLSYVVRCGHCKKLAPEFEKAATVLKNNDPPVTLAEVRYVDVKCKVHE